MRDGIIPAYAGSTALPRLAPTPPRDHPRIRGEHSLDKLLDCLVQESSPHTRGAQFYPDKDRWDIGIIPAYAGSTRDLPERLLMCFR